jgi:hypothetical protein
MHTADEIRRSFRLLKGNGVLALGRGAANAGPPVLFGASNICHV